MTLQRTIKKHVTLSGIGVHTGRVINLKIKPHLPNKGIVFRRIDLAHAPEVPAKYSYVVNTQFATTLGIGKVTISTVEHLLAAMHGIGIDNAIIELDGPEIPILDGSAYEFCKVLLTAGVEIQSDLRQELILKRPIELKIAEKWACAWPAPRFIIDASVEWDHQMIGYQSFKYDDDINSFSKIASARTFGFLKDVETLKNHGLLLGGSLKNAIVLDDCYILNPEGLRHPDEFVRHKVLDAIGDFKLIGAPIRAYFRLHRGGHELHNLLLKEIFKSPSNYEWAETKITDKKIYPIPQPIFAST